MNRVDFRFYAITGRHPVGMEVLLQTLDAGFKQGLRAVQIREKDLSTVELMDLTSDIKKAAETHGAMVLINDRVDVALALGLKGVHLPENGMPVGDARRLLGDSALIGVSAHDAERVRRSAGEGADFCVAGPVAASSSKQAGHWIMPERLFAEICETSPIPVFALGGITPAGMQKWLALGAHGIAGISIWLSPQQPENVFDMIKSNLGSL